MDRAHGECAQPAAPPTPSPLPHHHAARPPPPSARPSLVPVERHGEPCGGVRESPRSFSRTATWNPPILPLPLRRSRTTTPSAASVARPSPVRPRRPRRPSCGGVEPRRYWRARRHMELAAPALTCHRHHRRRRTRPPPSPVPSPVPPPPPPSPVMARRDRVDHIIESFGIASKHVFLGTSPVARTSPVAPVPPSSSYDTLSKTRTFYVKTRTFYIH